MWLILFNRFNCGKRKAHWAQKYFQGALARLFRGLLVGGAQRVKLRLNVVGRSPTAVPRSHRLIVFAEVARELCDGDAEKLGDLGHWTGRANPDATTSLQGRRNDLCLSHRFNCVRMLSCRQPESLDRLRNPFCFLGALEQVRHRRRPRRIGSQFLRLRSQLGGETMKLIGKREVGRHRRKLLPPTTLLAKRPPNGGPFRMPRIVAGRYRFRPRKSPADRFWSKVTPLGDVFSCWIWTGSIKPNGYGHFWLETGMPAHRFSYRDVIGEIPDGLHLDHLCRVRACVNPWHLEPVTVRENTLRGLAAAMNTARGALQTHCRYGHEYTPENTCKNRKGHRHCRTCKVLWNVVNRPHPQMECSNCGKRCPRRASMLCAKCMRNLALYGPGQAAEAVA